MEPYGGTPPQTSTLSSQVRTTGALCGSWTLGASGSGRCTSLRCVQSIWDASWRLCGRLPWLRCLHPFAAADLPPLVLPPIDYPSVLHSCAVDININEQILKSYLDAILPGAALKGRTATRDARHVARPLHDCEPPTRPRPNQATSTALRHSTRFVCPAQG
jgi:hypothetical protein